MHRKVALLLSCAAVLVAAATAGAAGAHRVGSVYTLTNAVAGNAVAVFARSNDGTLTPEGTFPTGGAGTGGGLGSQGALVLSNGGRELFAVNSGSDSISYFTVEQGGLELQDTIASGGDRLGSSEREARGRRRCRSPRMARCSSSPRRARARSTPTSSMVMA